MEHLPWRTVPEGFGISVQRVAQHRVSMMRKSDPNLVQETRLDRNLE